MFTSILSSVEGNLTIQNGLLCTVVSVVLGILIAVIYMQQGNYSKNFVVTLAMMPVLVQVVIMMVNERGGSWNLWSGAFPFRAGNIPGDCKYFLCNGSRTCDRNGLSYIFSSNGSCNRWYVHVSRKDFIW